jgi:glycerophosphoryl diester phosphodiesterase
MREDIFGIPVDRVDYARVREQKAFKALPDAACRVISYILGGKPPRALIPSRLFTHLRARGMPVLFLGVNDDADLKLAQEAGATAVLTDRPRWLSQRIKEGAVNLMKPE